MNTIDTTMNLSSAWQFNPIATSWPTNVLPNLAFWTATNGSWEYQIQLSWPLNWTSREETSVVETMYVTHPPFPIHLSLLN